MFRIYFKENIIKTRRLLTIMYVEEKWKLKKKRLNQNRGRNREWYEVIGFK